MTDAPQRFDEVRDRMFARDLARTIEISKRLVAMFDKDDGSYGGMESQQLWQEYQNMRKKWGGNGAKDSMKLFDAYTAEWDTREH